MFGYDTAVSVCLYISLLSGRRLSVILLVVSYLLCSPSVLAVRLWWWSVCVISFIYVSPSLSVFTRPIAVRNVAICQCPCPPGRGLSTSRRLSALPCRHLGVRVSVLVHLHALSICISSICISSICMKSFL